MPISTSCPTCGNSLKAPNQLAGKHVKCLRCDKVFTLPGLGAAGAGTATPPGLCSVAAVNSAGKQVVSGVVRVVFWLGVASLTVGLLAGLSTLFRATAGYSQALARLGILLGGGAVVLAVVREECGFTFPFAGSVASLLSLVLVAFWLGADVRQAQGMGGRPPGPPGGMDKWPRPDWKGGPSKEKGKDGPRPPRPLQGTR